MSKQKLPITRSVLAGAALVPVLRETYGLAIRDCRLIKAMILATYHVRTDEGHYILRIYPHGRRSRAEVEGELSFLNSLHALGVPVSVPLRTTAGHQTLSLEAPEGKRLAALFSFAPGHPLEPRKDLDSVRAYGRLLATVHQLADRLPMPESRPPLDFERLVAGPIARLWQTFPARRRDWAHLREMVPTLHAVIDALGKRAPQYGMCHGDVGPANVHVTQDGTLTLFDFDFCGPGWRAYDVSVFLIDCTDEVAEAFLAGYQEIRTLDEEELTAVPVLQVAQHIWLLGLRASYVDEWGTTYFSRQFVDSVLAAIEENLAKINGRKKR